MLYMNDYDFQMAQHRITDSKSAKGRALALLIAHREIVNANSDGWHVWAPPVKAAKRLMEVVQSPSSVSELTSEQGLRLALCPLRTFYTKHPQLPRPKGLDK